jgi:uncharacterized glyoxalase superfamily protein PhnB
MRYKYLTPMLWTSDLKATVAFYQLQLSFEISELNEEWGWCHMRKDGVDFMFAVPNEHTPYEKPVFTGTFYIYTDDIDELWEKVKDTPHIYYPIENFEYGMREFAIKDNNGYILQFGKDLLSNTTEANS